MKKAEKGILKITIDKDNKPIVMFHPVNGTIWMDRNELCDLFGIYIHQLNTHLDDIFKTKIFHFDDVCKYHRIVKDNRICYDITEVKLEVIIGISFRIESFNAGVLRDWLIKRFMQKENNLFQIPDMGNSFCLN